MLSPVEKEGRNYPGVCVVEVGVRRSESFPGRRKDMCEDPKIEKSVQGSIERPLRKCDSIKVKEEVGKITAD